MKRARFAFAFAILVGCAASSSVAQIAVEAHETPLDLVLNQIAEQSGERIFAAPSASGDLTCKLTCTSAEEALGVICATLGLEYKKVYLTLSDDDAITGSDLADIVSSLERVERSRVVVEGMPGQASLVFCQENEIPEDVNDTASGQSKPCAKVYLVRSPSDANAVSGRAPKVADLVEMEKARIFAQSSLSGQEQDELARRSADLFFSLDPEVRNNVVMDRLRMMANMTPDQRRQMREIMSGAWQNMPSDLRQRLENTAGWRGQDGGPPEG
jgi:hypothetical protein